VYFLQIAHFYSRRENEMMRGEKMKKRGLRNEQPPSGSKNGRQSSPPIKKTA
jgi:hypothetical protein